MVSVRKKIRKMNKKAIWPTILWSGIAFTFFLIIIVVVMSTFLIFFLDWKMEVASQQAENITSVIDAHLQAGQDDAKNYETEIVPKLSTDSNQILEELKNIQSFSGYEDAGIWVLNQDHPMSVANIEFGQDSNMYQSFEQGETGTSLEIVDGEPYLVYAVLCEYNGNHTMFYFAENANKLESDSSIEKLLKDSDGVYFLDKDDNTLAGFGTKSLNALNEKVMIFNDTYNDTYQKQANGTNAIRLILDSQSDINMEFYASQLLKMIVNADSSEAVITSSTDEPIDFNVWFETSTGANGWKLEINQHVILGKMDMNGLLRIGILASILMFIPGIIFVTNIFSGVRSNRRLTKVLYLDNVTGGKNWLYFKYTAERMLHKRRKNLKRYALVAFEVNDFRVFCDYSGNEAGDELLEQIDKQMNAMCEKWETFARYANAQYGILLQWETQDQLLERLDKIFNILGHNCTKERISFAVGVFLIEDSNVDIESMYNFASGAKDTVSGSLETQIAMFDVKIRNAQLREKEMEDTMVEALKNREFQVYLQPKYGTISGELSGAEALVRWISPSKGIMSPGEFIPLFEKNGFITKIDDYMLTEVAALQTKWMIEGKAVVPISVNVSRIHFTRVDLAEHIQNIVDACGTPHELIELELTESAFFDDKEVLLYTVNKLREYNFSLAMDDFGAGYSSLNSLKDLPLDIVKLDGEFFRESEDKERGEIVVKEAIKLVKNLKMKVVAEGVETKEQVQFLAEQGCDLIQGFYFAKPMPLDEFEKIAFIK